jgi:hypothetical protein
VEYFGLESNSNPRNTIIGIYYSMTTLSTVGFGDYNPRSNSERILAVALLIFGVSMFSYIMGEILNLIKHWNELNSVNESGKQLTRFFNVLKRFNDFTPINKEIQTKFE